MHWPVSQMKNTCALFEGYLPQFSKRACITPRHIRMGSVAYEDSSLFGLSHMWPLNLLLFACIVNPYIVYIPPFVSGGPICGILSPKNLLGMIFMVASLKDRGPQPRQNFFNLSNMPKKRRR